MGTYGWRPMIQRAISVAREAIPSAEIAIKSGIRAAMGVALLSLPDVGPTLHHWIEFAGKMFVMLAAIGIVFHIEGTVIKHLAAKLQVEVARVRQMMRDRRERNQARMAQMANCRRCGCSSCPYEDVK